MRSSATSRDTATQLTVRDTRALRRRTGLWFHRNTLLPVEQAVARGIRATTATRTILDLASILPSNRLQRVVHEAEVQRLCTPGRLRAILGRHPGARGSRVLLAILGMGGEGALPTRSELEDRYLRFLASRGHPLPRTNVRIDTPRGRFEVDCIWRELGLVVELDGARYHGTKIAKERDAHKDRALAAVGLRVMHVSWRLLTEDSDGHDEELRIALAR